MSKELSFAEASIKWQKPIVMSFKKGKRTVYMFEPDTDTENIHTVKIIRNKCK